MDNAKHTRLRAGIPWTLVIGIALAIASPAQTFTTLASLSGDVYGALPGAIGQKANGGLWITTTAESRAKCGTVLKLTLAGKLSKFSNFNCREGDQPQGLALGIDGNYYGMTCCGGTGNGGTIFKLTPNAKLTVLYNFTLDGSSGSSPVGTLVQGIDGNLYGATYSGGTVNSYGTVFKITSDGTLTTLYQFDFTHGAQPYAGLVLAADGNFYGTTCTGGAAGQGTVYQITSQGNLTVIHSFGGHSRDPSCPTTSLTLGADGNFYGTTLQGGSNNYGTVFRVTPTGGFTALHNFLGTDGYGPVGLIQATDGNFYGTTAYGGADGIDGTIFQMTPTGTVTTIHSFNHADGDNPTMLFQNTNGMLYGITGGGGYYYCYYDQSYGCGTIFSLDVGLDPFVTTLPNVGSVGAPVIILGTKLKGIKSVSFNGTAAKFTVNSNSEIRTTVPVGATTGTVTVTGRDGTLLSNMPFTVTI